MSLFTWLPYEMNTAVHNMDVKNQEDLHPQQEDEAVPESEGKWDT